MTAKAAIALSALVAGILDIAATSTLMRAQGVPFGRPLQFVASGALGLSAMNGGTRTATIGLALHFLVAAIWAGIYAVAADAWPGLLLHPLLCGVLFGAVIHLVMSRVVVPLSRTQPRPFSWKAWLSPNSLSTSFVSEFR